MLITALASLILPPSRVLAAAEETHPLALSILFLMLELLKRSLLPSIFLCEQALFTAIHPVVVPGLQAQRILRLFNALHSRPGPVCPCLLVTSGL